MTSVCTEENGISELCLRYSGGWDGWMQRLMSVSVMCSLSLRDAMSVNTRRKVTIAINLENRK